MQKLKHLWQLIWRWLRPPKPFKTIRVEELPDFLDKQNLYLVGEGNYIWFITMLCPCKCGEVIQLSLMANNHSRWQLTEHFDGTVSLYPSIWRTVGCRSHFFIHKSLITWCK